MKIITLENDQEHCLKKKAEAISETPEGFEEAGEIIARLEETIFPLMPVAGLAAPQINISKRVFLFSWDRSIDHLEATINASYDILNEDKVAGWEGCLSVPLLLAKVPRYTQILARYINRQGEPVTYKLYGFAARVFQHECDHLDGIPMHLKPHAEIKKFTTQDDFMQFINNVRKQDKVQYIKPEKHLSKTGSLS